MPVDSCGARLACTGELQFAGAELSAEADNSTLKRAPHSCHSARCRASMQARPCGTFCNMDPIEIGAIVFPRMDQMDFTGPFEVLSRIPGARFHVLWKDKAPVRDIKGLILTPEMTFAEAPQLDVLVVPGGWGQEQLMDDESLLSFMRARAAHAADGGAAGAGALLGGPAGLEKGVQGNPHWTALH